MKLLSNELDIGRDVCTGGATRRRLQRVRRAIPEHRSIANSAKARPAAKPAEHTHDTSPPESSAACGKTRNDALTRSPHPLLDKGASGSASGTCWPTDPIAERDATGCALKAEKPASIAQFGGRGTDLRTRAEALREALHPAFRASSRRLGSPRSCYRCGWAGMTSIASSSSSTNASIRSAWSSRTLATWAVDALPTRTQTTSAAGRRGMPTAGSRNLSK